MSYDPSSVFAFLDETGTLNKNNPISTWGVGAIVHPMPDETICELHNCFERLCSALKSGSEPDPTRLEFKFSEIRESSVVLYERCLSILERDTKWRFFSLLVDLDNPKFIYPVNSQQEWEKYLMYTSMLLKNNLQPQEQAILIADFYKRPRGKVHEFATLPSIVPQLRDVLQVESQGILLVQMADVLLGGSVYKGENKAKLKIATRVQKLRTSLGRRRFNEWHLRI